MMTSVVPELKWATAPGGVAVLTAAPYAMSWEVRSEIWTNGARKWSVRAVIDGQFGICASADTRAEAKALAEAMARKATTVSPDAASEVDSRRLQHLAKDAFLRCQNGDAVALRQSDLRKRARKKVPCGFGLV